MEWGYIICAVWLVVCLVDLHNHNNKVNEMFPDHSDRRQNEKRHDLTISFYGFGFLIIMMIGFFIRSVVGG